MNQLEDKSRPDISIVTPSFNMLSSLKLCHASVMDQGIACEHIVMDGASTDGTREWLQDHAGDLVGISEKDKGMYNALNKAIALTNAEIIGHLNSDEQYLPGTLKFVKDFFDQHPEVDFLASDFLVIDPSGDLVAYRKTFQPRWPYFFSNYLYTTTCTLFYRRKIFLKCQFDESYRSIADVIFLYKVLRSGFKGRHIKKYASVFTFSGNNLSLNPISAREKQLFNKTLPFWYRLVKPLYFVLFFAEKLFHGNYSQTRPLRFSIFTNESPCQRVLKEVKNPRFRLKFKISSTPVEHK